MSATVRKLGKLIFGGYFIAAMYSALAVIMLAMTSQGGGLGAVLIPWSTGLLSGASVSFLVAQRTSAVQRSLRVEGRGSWGHGEIAARVRMLNLLWLLASGATAVVGLGVILGYDGTDRLLAGIGTLMGLAIQIQSRVLLWSATRALNEFAQEITSERWQ